MSENGFQVGKWYAPNTVGCDLMFQCVDKTERFARFAYYTRYNSERIAFCEDVGGITYYYCGTRRTSVIKVGDVTVAVNVPTDTGHLSIWNRAEGA